jgi:hypothetical protein
VNAELLTHKRSATAVAKTIAETAIADCKARAGRVGRRGRSRRDTLVATRDGRLAHHGECAPKAYTARSASRRRLAKRFVDNDPQAAA